MRCRLWDVGEASGQEGSWAPSPSPARGDSALPVLQELAQEELFVAVEMLSAVVLINRALEAKDASGFWSSLVSPAMGLAEVDRENAQR